MLTTLAAETHTKEPDNDQQATNLTQRQHDEFLKHWEKRAKKEVTLADEKEVKRQQTKTDSHTHKQDDPKQVDRRQKKNWKKVNFPLPLLARTRHCLILCFN